jgi:serine/threonine protein phosphatase PrpC
VAGRASIVGAAETSVGKVREHNEDSHFIDPEAGIFVVCDGMGGHAAGEVASAIAVATVREAWSSDEMQAAADQWLAKGTHEAHKQLLGAVTEGVIAAHDAIIAETKADRGKTGMGTTIVGAMVVGNEMVFAHCGDSRAYIVRDGIAMQLTEDHTLLARLLAAGVDVDTEGEGSRFKSMLTNALGIGAECKASTFVVPLADGDRFLLCSDGITEYVKEFEIGEVLGKSASPARAAQRLVEMALDRGGGDNATALVVRVREAGEVSRPAEELRREEAAIFACPLWAKVTPQQRLRALRIALPREYAAGEKVAAQTLGDRVAWILIDGQLVQEGATLAPGALVYPEALLTERPLPDKDGLAVAKTDVRLLALRSDDFRELCEDDPDLAEQLLSALGEEIATRLKKKLVSEEAGRAATMVPDSSRTSTKNIRPKTDPGSPIVQPQRAATEPPALPDPPVRTTKTTDLGATPIPRPPALPSVPNPFRQHPRGSTPPSEKSLIAPKAETEAALDKAMDKMTVDSMWGEPDDEGSQPETKPDALTSRKRAESDAGVPREIVVEADAPPEPVVAKKPPGLSDPEISITTLADESDEHVIEMTADDPSQPVKSSDESEPEIVIVKPGRAITADDTKLVAGAIDTKRPKRQTDA